VNSQSEALNLHNDVKNSQNAVGSNKSQSKGIKSSQLMSSKEQRIILSDHKVLYSQHDSIEEVIENEGADLMWDPNNNKTTENITQKTKT